MLTVEPVPAAPVRVGIMGTGLMAASHISTMVGREDTVVAAVCEPSAAAYEATTHKSPRPAAPTPPNEPDWRRFVERMARDELDVVFIITPHALHFEQASAALEAGLDVLLEKPMVMNAAGGRSADRDPRPDRPAAGGRLPGQPLAAGPCRGADAARRRARRAPQHQRRGLAGLGGADDRDVAPGPGHVGRRVPVRYRRPHAQHRHRHRRAGDRPGRGLAGGRRPAGRHPRRDDRPARVGGPRDDERLWPGDPRHAARTSGCSASAATLRTGIWGERLEMQKSGRAARSQVRSVRSNRLGAVPGRPQRRPSRTPARPRSA